MKYIFSVMIALTLSLTTKALTYEEGAADAITMVNSLKATLLASGYAGWGDVYSQQEREIKDGQIGDVVDPYAPPTGNPTALILVYSWSQPSFNVMAWSDISVTTVRDWAYNNRNVNDYYRGYYDFFTNYWFFDDFGGLGF
jgi:hypothetical protein